MKVVRKLRNETPDLRNSKAELFYKKNKEQLIKIQKSPLHKSLVIFMITAVLLLVLVIVLVLYVNENLFGKAVSQGALTRPVTLTACGNPSNGWLADTVYILNRNIAVPSGGTNCFTFDSVTPLKLDCNGFTISGTPAQTGVILSRSTDVTIEDCKFYNFGTGIELTSGSTNNVINDNFIEGHRVGISVIGASNNNIFNRNQIKGNVNEGTGLQIRGSDGNVFTRNELAFDPTGIDLVENSNENSFINNNIHGHRIVGLRFSGISGNNFLIHNQFANNALAIDVVSGADNRLKENILCDGNAGLFQCAVPVLDGGDNYFSAQPAVGCGSWSGFRNCPPLPDFLLDGCAGRQCGGPNNICGPCGSGLICDLNGRCGYCGNGVVDAGEQCDTAKQCSAVRRNAVGNICNINGDCTGPEELCVNRAVAGISNPIPGCTATCTEEPGYDCTRVIGSPSICTTTGAPPTLEICTNFNAAQAIDDDGDDLANCADPDCSNQACEVDGDSRSAVCSSGSRTCVELACADGKDNDGDGNIDLADSDCPADPAPTFMVEYFRDVSFTQSLGRDPRLGVGTYYLKVTASEPLSGSPTISITAEGAANHITNIQTTPENRILTEFSLIRRIISDPLAVGLVRENIQISGADAAGNSAVNVDPTNEATHAAFTQTVIQDTTPPIISDLTATNPTSNSIDISLMTNNEDATCEYKRTTDTTYVRMSTTSALSHSHAATGLTASTPYQFDVRCTDAAGNQATSQTNSLSTLSAGPSCLPRGDLTLDGLITDNDVAALALVVLANNQACGNNGAASCLIGGIYVCDNGRVSDMSLTCTTTACTPLGDLTLDSLITDNDVAALALVVLANNQACGNNGAASCLIGGIYVCDNGRVSDMQIASC